MPRSLRVSGYKVSILRENKRETDSKLESIGKDMTKVLTILETMKDVPNGL
ncbi:hypothetical protein AGMMS49944_23020 [Spirochaetia bacterium]|nr:hypothetical protein AGMMS49944_23020 [Spirochaetia bacterium]